jgi:hypothetical protein
VNFVPLVVLPAIEDLMELYEAAGEAFWKMGQSGALHIQGKSVNP